MQEVTRLVVSAAPVESFLLLGLQFVSIVKPEVSSRLAPPRAYR